MVNQILLNQVYLGLSSVLLMELRTLDIGEPKVKETRVIKKVVKAQPPVIEKKIVKPSIKERTSAKIEVSFDIIGLLESIKKELVFRDAKIGYLQEALHKKAALIEKKKEVKKVTKPIVKLEKKGTKDEEPSTEMKILQLNCGFNIFGDDNEKLIYEE